MSQQDLLWHAQADLSQTSLISLWTKLELGQLGLAVVSVLSQFCALRALVAAGPI